MKIVNKKLLSPDQNALRHAVDTEMERLYDSVAESMVDWLIRDFYQQSVLSAEKYLEAIEAEFSSDSEIYEELKATIGP